MAIKQFAIPLDASSIQTGDISFKQLVEAGSRATFQLTDVGASQTGELDLITSRGGKPTSHTFKADVKDGLANATLTTTDLESIYHDAVGGDWDYVEAHWTADEVDTPDPSVCNITQGGHTFDLFGWPPKKKK
jgi:hypothetical protein